MRPESIVHRWDILYHDYPDVYDEFASFPYTPWPLDIVAERFVLAEHAARVIGIEPEDAMRSLAEADAERRGLANRVSFLKGSHEAIPLAGGSVDALTASTAPLYVPEARRLDISPGWYGGGPQRGHRAPGDPAPGRQVGEQFVRAGFSFFDFDSVQEYGTVDNIVRTYGFIFGRKAIAHLRETGRTPVRWRFRVHHRLA